jgi:hypothetical protein
MIVENNAFLPDFDEGNQVQVDPMTWPNKTYEDYVTGAKEILLWAVEVEKFEGLEAASDLYRDASNEFLGAIGSVPAIEGTRDLPETDPVLLIQYASCLEKQVVSGSVEPYTRERGLKYRNSRQEDLARIAKDTFKIAWKGVVGDIGASDETILDAALVTANGLEKIQGPKIAKQVLSEARNRFASHDTDPDLIAFIDKRAFVPKAEKEYSDEDVATDALKDLATDSHEVLEMVA